MYMERKKAFIIAGLVLVVLVVGVLVFLFVTNPEVLTRVPTEQESVVEPGEEEIPLESEPEEEQPSLISYFPGALSRLAEVAGSCLVLTEENCFKAFYPHDKSTGNIAPGVGFNFVGKEITLYSPIDGYAQIFFSKSGGEGFLSITANAPRVPASTMDELNDPNRNKTIMLIGHGIESLVINDSLVFSCKKRRSYSGC